MLTAIRLHTSNRVYAKSATPSDGPFVCPGCGQQVTLRRPRERAVANFAHRPGSECAYARGESPRHLEVKQALYDALREQGIPAELEFDTGNTRADVYFEHAGREYVIEVQRSRITVEKIKDRMRKHAAADRVVVWVLTTPVPAPRAVVAVPGWTRQVTGLAYGVGFHHHSGEFLWPVAYRRATRFVPEREYFDEGMRDYQLGGGYAQTFLGKRRVYPAPTPIRVSDLDVAVRQGGELVGVLPYKASAWNRRRYPERHFQLRARAECSMPISGKKRTSWRWLLTWIS